MLFLLSDIAHATNILYLLAGGACIAGGILLKLSFPKPELPPATRFRLIKEMRNPKPRPPKEKKPFRLSLFGKKSAPPQPAQSAQKGGPPPAAAKSGGANPAGKQPPANKGKPQGKK